MVTPVASLAPMHDEPFLGSAAMASGRLTRHRLRTSYRRLYRDVYLPAEVELTAAARARAAWLSLGDRVTLAGGSAAALHGTKWLDAESPAEVIRSDRNHQSGIVVHDYELRADETMHIRGMQVTTPARTAFDIGRTRPAQLAIPMLDALLRATATNASRRPGSGRRPTGRPWRATADLTSGPRRRRRRIAAGNPVASDPGQRGLPRPTACSTGSTQGNDRGTSSASPCWKSLAGW